MDNLSQQLSNAYIESQQYNPLYRMLAPVIGAYDVYQRNQEQKQQGLADLMSNQADAFYGGMPLNGVCPTCGKPF